MGRNINEWIYFKIHLPFSIHDKKLLFFNEWVISYHNVYFKEIQFWFKKNITYCKESHDVTLERFCVVFKFMVPGL